jgi:hypothetical protein
VDLTAALSCRTERLVAAPKGKVVRAASVRVVVFPVESYCDCPENQSSLDFVTVSGTRGVSTSKPNYPESNQSGILLRFQERLLSKLAMQSAGAWQRRADIWHSVTFHGASADISALL